MNIEINEVGENLRKVTLKGRLDTPGVLAIEPRFVTGIVPGGKNAIVDISQVDFIASMGIRMFIAVARNMKDRHAKLALYAPQPNVDELLESAAFRQLVPVCADAQEAATVVNS